MKEEKKYLEGTKIEDLRGRKFGRLTVVEFDWDRYRRDLIRVKNNEIGCALKCWICKCECGKYTKNSITSPNLKNGHTTSCGCYNIECIKERKDEDLVGKKFNKLTVISRDFDREKLEYDKFGRWQKYWKCKCDCGSDKVVVVSTSTIKGNGTKSCGCIIKTATGDAAKIRAKNGNSIMHFLINKYGEDMASKMTSNEYNKNLNLFEINRGNSNIHIHINCMEVDYHGSYEVTPCHLSDAKKPTGCPYCSGGNGKTHEKDSLAAIFPKVIDIWSDKNSNSPYEYAIGSDTIVWWKCGSGIHDDYQRKISDYVRAKYDCPYCALERKESMLQKNVRLYLSDVLGYKLNHEWSCTIVPKNPKIKNGNNTMPFDNEVVDLKLIIEVHGEQHYKMYSLNSMWKDKTGLNPQQALYKRKLYDRYKHYIAYKNGYHYLEIPYWTEDDESYKVLIDEKINKIIKLKEVAVNGY